MHMYIYLDIYVSGFRKIHSNAMCIELMACNKAGVDRNVYKLHCTFSPSTLWFFTCITDIGAHKPWHVAPFAMHDFSMYYIPNMTKIFLICMFVMLHLYVLHGNKTYSLSLSYIYIYMQYNMNVIMLRFVLLPFYCRLLSTALKFNPYF